MLVALFHLFEDISTMGLHHWLLEGVRRWRGMEELEPLSVINSLHFVVHLNMQSHTLNRLLIEASMVSMHLLKVERQNYEVAGPKHCVKFEVPSSPATAVVRTGRENAAIHLGHH